MQVLAKITYMIYFERHIYDWIYENCVNNLGQITHISHLQAK